MRGDEAGLVRGRGQPQQRTGGLAHGVAPRLRQLDRLARGRRNASRGHDRPPAFAAVHVPYIQPGETRDPDAHRLEPLPGRLAAGRGHLQDLAQHLDEAGPTPEWAREPHAWQQLHINSPEDELRIRFRDLPQVGEECARHGVKAIQLVGWNDGGQDQGNPSHDPDPRLGTLDELKAGHRRIQALGVKIILFAKFTWADRATERFRNGSGAPGDQGPLRRLLHASRLPVPDGHPTAGHQHQAPDPDVFPRARNTSRVRMRNSRKTVELGADGILFDECLHHGPALLCFDPEHGHRYGAPVYANDRKLIQNFTRYLAAGQAGIPLCRRGLLRLGNGGLPSLVPPQREQATHPSQPLPAARRASS